MELEPYRYEVFYEWAFIVRVFAETREAAENAIDDYFPTASLVRPFEGTTLKVQVTIHQPE